MTRRAPTPGPGTAWALLLLAAVVALGSTALGQDGATETADATAAAADGPTTAPGDTEPERATDAPASPTAEPAAVPDTAATDAADAAAHDAAEDLMRNAHVGELAMRTRTTLQLLRPLLRPNDEVGNIERRLPSVELEIERLADPARRAHIAHVSQRELAELAQEWLRHETTFEAWQATLTARVEEIEAVRAELVELRRTWAALRDASNTLGRPDGRHERIIASLESVRTAGEELDARRDLVTSLQDRVSELVIVSEDVSDEIRTASAAFREHLLVRDRLPLWAGLGPPSRGGPPEGAAGPHADAEDAASEHEPSALERVQAELEMVAQQLSKATRLAVLFLALAAALVFLRRRSASWPEGEALAIPRAVVSRPLSVALLATLFIAPLSLTHAPILFYDLLAIVLLAPLARVLPAVSSPPARPLVYILVAFLLVSRIEGMIDDQSDPRRVLVLLECVALAAAMLAWARRSVRVADPVIAWLTWLAAVIALVAAVALVANVLGWLFLATMLVRGTAFSIQTGLVLVAGVVVVQALVDLAIRSRLGQRLHGLREHGALVRLRVRRLLTAGALAFWGAATLSGYGVWSSVSESVAAALGREWEIGSLVISLGRVGTAVIILVLTLWLSRLLRFVLELDVLPRLALEPGVDGAVSGLTRYVVVGVGILLSLAALGIDASQLALVAGALGVGVGFGLQGIVANFIAGLVLMLERPVRLGDLIQVGTLTGTVDRIGLRSSTVRATDGSEVIVPNESLISRELVNWTLSDRKRRVQLLVGVAYGTDPKRALEVIGTAVAAQAGVLGAASGGGPEPSIAFDAFGASSLDFVIKFWTADIAQADTLKSVVGIAVHDALVAAGIEIPFPQHDVRIVSVPEGAPKLPLEPAAPKGGAAD